MQGLVTVPRKLSVSHSNKNYFICPVALWYTASAILYRIFASNILLYALCQSVSAISTSSPVMVPALKRSLLNFKFSSASINDACIKSMLFACNCRLSIACSISTVIWLFSSFRPYSAERILASCCLLFLFCYPSQKPGFSRLAYQSRLAYGFWSGRQS